MRREEAERPAPLRKGPAGRPDSAESRSLALAGGKAHDRCLRSLTGRDVCGRGLTYRPERANERIYRAEVVVAHVAQREPRHRRTRRCARDREPLLLRQLIHEQTQIDWIGRAPRACPADRIAGEPLSFIDLAGRERVARRVAIIATCGLREITAALDQRPVEESLDALVGCIEGSGRGSAETKTDTDELVRSRAAAPQRICFFSWRMRMMVP